MMLSALPPHALSKLRCINVINGNVAASAEKTNPHVCGCAGIPSKEGDPHAHTRDTKATQHITQRHTDPALPRRKRTYLTASWANGGQQRMSLES